MTEVKVRLSMSVLGAQMLSSQECEENSENNNIENLVVTFEKKGKLHKKVLTISTRKSRLVKQVINITKDAYDYMTAADQPPTDKMAKKFTVAKVVGKDKNGKPKKVVLTTTAWAQLSIKKRLNWHMSRIAESLGAISYTFEILDD